MKMIVIHTSLCIIQCVSVVNNIILHLKMEYESLNLQRNKGVLRKTKHGWLLASRGLTSTLRWPRVWISLPSSTRWCRHRAGHARAVGGSRDLWEDPCCWVKWMWSKCSKWFLNVFGIGWSIRLAFTPLINCLDGGDEICLEDVVYSSVKGTVM